MKTILTRMKTVVDAKKVPGGTLQYVKFSEVAPPDIDGLQVSKSILPSIFFFPISSSETWETTQRKLITYGVGAHLVMEYNVRELSIIGDATRAGTYGKGILDFVEDFLTVFRGHRLEDDGQLYLDKPLEIQGIEYFREDLSADLFCLIATVTMQCTRLFLQTSLPGDIHS
jgi:hypothetical protein